MQIQCIQQNQLKFDKKTVNPASKIYVSCGNISVHIQNYYVFCKYRRSFFDVGVEFHE